MPLIGVLSTFTDGNVITAAPHNSNWTDVKNAFNNSAVLTDVAKVIAVTHVWSASQTFTGGATFGAPLVPAATGVTDIGSAAARFKDLHLSGQVLIGGVALGNPVSLDWVPDVKFGGSNAGVTYALNGQIGRSLKIGKLVIVWARIALTSNGTGSGAATIAGLPFLAAVSPFPYPPLILRADNITFSGALQGYVDRGTTDISLEQVSAGTGIAVAITEVEFQNNGSLMLGAVYSTD